MYCPNCKQEYDGKFCPECGTKLIEKPAPSGVSLNLGDANAISGGLHVSDSHAVHNEDKSVHNITNTTSTVNNITQVSAQKTELELLQERKTQFLNACKRAYEDNVLNQKEIIELQELRIKLGLDEKTADEILVKVKAWSDSNAKKSELPTQTKVKLQSLTDKLLKNEVKALMEQIDSLESYVKKYDNDELSRKYYLVLAALKPEKCIEQKERTKTDTYWEAFWCYLAYIKAGRLIDAEETLASLDHFSNYPEDNMTVLAAAGELMKGHPEEAKEYLDATTGEYTPALQRFVDSLYLLLAPQKAKKSGADENTCAFYLVNFFGQKDPKVKAEEERLRKAKEEEEAKRKAKEEEAKRKAKEAEEARKRAEEERRRLEAERKAKEEAIRKAKEAEEARRRREEEERKRQAEEAERRRKEEERRKKEAVAWNVLQSCSNEDIEKYGISIISFAQGKKPTIYYRGYTFECQEEITKIKSHFEVESFSKLIALREGKGIFEVKDYIRKDFETYYKENSKTLANSDNIITFCSESDLYKLWRNKREVHVRKHVQEMQLLPLCFDPNKDSDSIYSIEYQNFFCDAELGGGICEILQAGFLGGHRDNLKEMDLGVDSEPILKKLSSFEEFTQMVLGAIVQYKILNRTYEDDIVLLGVFPFDINAEIWVNGRYRDNLKLLESNTTIPCTTTKTIVDDNCSSIIISMLGKRFALNVPKLFGYVPESFDITLRLDGFSDFKFTLKDKASKKEVSLQNEELLKYEEDGLSEHIRHKREAEEAERRAEEEAKQRAEEDSVIDKLVENTVLVEGGKFMMGATPDQDSNVKDEQPAHWVKLSPFRICRYEVTLEEWATLMGSYPTSHRDPKRPVVNVSWDDCQEFIKKLNSRTGLNFRLPTEAEWEFAARGGNKSKGFKYAGSNNLDEIAWTWKNSGDALLDEYDKETVKNNRCRTHDVGQKAPNELGLYDMCGNIWEWCADWYGNYSSSDQENPKGPSSGTERVQRGGCYSTKNPARVAYRLSGVINEKYANLGFRLASEPTANDLKQLQEEEAKRRAAIKTHNGHEYVDLGLPSGTLWATCNIGASKPEEFGNYFAWGETSGYDEGKRSFDKEHYKFMKKTLGLYWSITKYKVDKFARSIDQGVLERYDNAGYVLWGEGWRIPNSDNFRELINKKYTICKETICNGIRGLLIISKTYGNSIFLPFGGCYASNKKKGENKAALYWSRTLCSEYEGLDANEEDHQACEYNAVGLTYAIDYSNEPEIIGCSRYHGLNIRPVRFDEK